ncbi:MAG: 50S ribosomal protein L37ae [Candidatus Diapherotrites archaeon]|nr:50S ribosomal protein L37ae [Candidatus Diapherotrites archaeon]
MTKKVKQLGKFGSRYGVGIRKRLLKIESNQYREHHCPCCDSTRIKREAAGVFNCKKCGAEFAGGAYVPETMAGTIVKKMVTQKSFVPNLRDLVASKEQEPKEEKKEKKPEAPKTVSKTEKKKKTAKNPSKTKKE